MFGPQPIGISRRALLKDAACGFGYLAFAGLASQAAAAEPNPLAAEAAALRPRGQAGDLPVHARRAQPGRHLRLQAARWPETTASRPPS